jgi:hypothetical protein
MKENVMNGIKGRKEEENNPELLFIFLNSPSFH